MTSAYELLESIFAEYQTYKDIIYTLEWDQQVVMPKSVDELRGKQYALLARQAHLQITNPRIPGMIRAVEQDMTEHMWQRRNLELMRRMHENATAIPEAMVTRRAEAKVAACSAWADAKRENRFPAVALELAELVQVFRETADAISQKHGISRYEALLREYEPDFKEKDLDVIFGELKTGLPPLIEAILAKQSREPDVVPLPKVPVEQQQVLTRKIAKAMGFDFNRGRLDVSAHPFSSDMIGDNRITTRYNEADVLQAVQAVIHEVGHGLYNQGLSGEWAGQPVGQPCSTTIHETQSLFFDMSASRTKSFAQWLSGVMNDTLTARGDFKEPAFSAENVHRLMNRVERSLIRIEADSVTYPLHVITRYEIERDLIEGRMEVKDLPERWNADIKANVGVEVPDDRRGCLQDIHWFDGNFGYFPTYTLGAMGAAQLYEAAKKELGFMPRGFADGDFSPAVDWLRGKVHHYANSLPGPELLKQATGQELTASSFLASMRERYGIAAPQL